MFSIEIENKLKFVENLFGSMEKGTKNNVQVFCQNCKKISIKPVKKRKLAIAYDKNFIVKCWVCGYKNSFAGCVYDFFGKSAYIDYIKRFKDENYKKIVEVIDKEEKVILPEDFRLILFDNSISSKKAKKYLFDRGGNERDLWYFRLGVSNEFKWKNRLIMPSFDVDGELNCIYARDITNESMFKYVNSNIDKNSIVFNELHIDWTEELTLVEGMFDLIKCNENAIPLLGSSFNENSYLFVNIMKWKTPILLALDPDVKAKAMRIANLLISYEIPVRFMEFDTFDDVGAMSKSDFKRLSKTAPLWTYEQRIQSKLESLINVRNVL